MCEAIGKKVLALHRAKIGNLGVKDLKIGQWRFLKKNEVEILLKDI
jgi:23S rRNA pseudouridine2605 synthase